jgi:hypothetical protein
VGSERVRVCACEYGRDERWWQREREEGGSRILEERKKLVSEECGQTIALCKKKKENFTLIITY